MTSHIVYRITRGESSGLRNVLTRATRKKTFSLVMYVSLIGSMPGFFVADRSSKLLTVKTAAAAAELREKEYIEDACDVSIDCHLDLSGFKIRLNL